MRTTDGGLSWTRTGSPTPSAFIGEMRFVDPSIGWLIATVPDNPSGQCGGTPPPPCRTGIFKTQDGGATWNEQAADPAVRQDLPSVHSLVAVDANHAWALTGYACDAGCPSHVVGTDDGKTWRQIAALPEQAQALDFVDTRRGWTTTRTQGRDSSHFDGRARIYRTLDGGATWTQLFYADGVSPFFRIDFVDARLGWALGNDFGGNCSMGGCYDYTLYRTQDGGLTWSVQQVPQSQWWAPEQLNAAAGFLGRPQFVTAQVGWFEIDPSAGPGVGGILVTEDGGQSWARYGSDEDWVPTAIAPARGRVAWVLVWVRRTHTQMLMFTSDGGRTWQRQLADVIT